jgi:Na+-driven multidrug efflux pump
MIVEIIAIMSINIVDTYFIGQIGTAPLAAISFCFPAILTLTSFAIGLGPGTSSVVARAYGRSDKKRGLSVGYS